jgi:serine/threonine protein kinase
LGPYASPEDAAARDTLIRSRIIHAGKIGKLTTPREAAKEMSLARGLKRIDPHQNLFLYGLDSCEINPAELRDGANYSPELKLCIEGTRNPLHTTPPESAVQVFMKYGGHDLLNLDSSLASDAPQLFNSMVRLFDGLQLLHRNNLVHLDFKLQNTVLRRESGIYKPYIIDFGLMGPISRIYAYHSSINWSAHVYAPYPPEICLLDIRLVSKTARLLKSSAPPRASGSSIISSVTVSTPKSVIIDDYIDVYLKTRFAPSIESSGFGSLRFLGVPFSVIRKPDGTTHIDAAYLAYMRDLTNFLFVAPNASEAAADLQTWLDIDYNQLRAWTTRYDGAAPEPADPVRFDVARDTVMWRFYDKFLRGIDAYSLGLVLASVAYQLLGIRTYISPPGRISIVLYDKYHAIIDNSTLPPDTRKFILNFYGAVMQPLNKIVTGLMNFKFTKRMEISEAKASFIALLPQIDKWCSKPGYDVMLTYMKILEDPTPLPNYE